MYFLYVRYCVWSPQIPRFQNFSAFTSTRNFFWNWKRDLHVTKQPRESGLSGEPHASQESLSDLQQWPEALRTSKSFQSNKTCQWLHAVSKAIGLICGQMAWHKGACEWSNSFVLSAAAPRVRDGSARCGGVLAAMRGTQHRHSRYMASGMLCVFCEGVKKRLGMEGGSQHSPCQCRCRVLELNKWLLSSSCLVWTVLFTACSG